jgi:hypothetical protein
MSKQVVALLPQQNNYVFVSTQFSILFLWQSKVVDLVGNLFPHFYIVLYSIELALVLHIAEILLAGRESIVKRV